MRFLRLHEAAEINVSHLSRAARGSGVAYITKACDGKMLFRKTQQLRAITTPGPSMAHDWQPSIILQKEAFGVLESLAVVQLPPFLEFREKIFSADFGIIEIVVPLEQIFDGGMDGAITGLFEIGDVQHVAVRLFFLLLGHSAIGDERGVIVPVQW